MKNFGDILLISCYELGHQPLGIAMPAGFLKRAGYSPDVLDLSVDRLDPGKISRAQMIGISVPMHTALRLGVFAAKEIRKINPGVHICFFGLYASLNSRYLLDHVADSVIGGEYESPLVKLVDRLAGTDSSPVEGVSLKESLSAPYLKRMTFSSPDRSLLPPLDRYAVVEQNGARKKTGYVEASRGCRHLCLHCPITPVYEGRFFIVPEDVVLEDVRRLVREGASHITFGDPDFLNGPGHSLRIVRAMHQEFPSVTFDFTAKIEHILKRRELMKEFSTCGCAFIISAIESFSDTVLTHLRKGHTRNDIPVAFSILKKAGITMRPSLVPFTPWTTLEDYIEMMKYIEEHGLIDYIDPVQLTIRLLIPPGSALLSQESIKPYLGPLIQESFTYRWNHPDPRMDGLQKRASQIVEEAAQRDEDPEITFYRIKESAYAVLENRTPHDIHHAANPNRTRPPRLTEPWFCCAEPTEGQFKVFQEYPF